MAAVASALGLEFTGKLTAKLSQSIFKYLSSKKNCLLVLDNFETPWEPRETRAKVEEFLSLLGDLRKVALLVRASDMDLYCC
jgi:ABC-type lipopolysaccharide export system ATPase subunit